MNPAQKLEFMLYQLLTATRRTELYTLGLYSIELAKLGIVPPDKLQAIIDMITERIADEIREGEPKWPGPKNLAA